MSSSASFMPQPVEPPTTIQTKSSFSEIEALQEPSLYHLTLSDPSFTSSSLYTPQCIEPFISPLTEANLNYHKSTFSSSLEIKQHHVDSFIQNQKALLRQEQELQRKTKAEIQSLIPLDTQSFDEELILDDKHHWADPLSYSTMATSRKRFSFSSLPSPRSDRRGRTALAHSWFSNIVDYKGHETTGNNPTFTSEQHLSIHRMNNDYNKDLQKSSKRQWLKSITRWIRFGQGKKRDNVGQDNVEQQLYHQRQSPLSLATMTATAIEEDKLRHETTVDSTLDDDFQQYDEQRHQTRKAARHVSWSMGTDFEEYKLNRHRNQEHELFGGGSQRRSKPPHLFLPTRHAGNTEDPPTATLMTHSAPTSPISSTTNQQKRGIGFSFVQNSLSSTTKSLFHPRKRLTRRMKRKVYRIDPHDDIQALPLEDVSSINRDQEDDINAATMDHPYIYHQQLPVKNDTHKRRYSSGHLIDKYSPRLSALKEEADVMAANRQNLVAFRYPRMMRLKDVHSTAKHMLSVEGDEERTDYLAGDGGHYNGSGNWLSDRYLYNKRHVDGPHDGGNGMFGVENDEDDIEDDDDNSLVKYSWQYRNSSKRFSDPGGLSAPPFPIGRPLSTFYD